MPGTPLVTAVGPFGTVSGYSATSNVVLYDGTPQGRDWAVKIGSLRVYFDSADAQYISSTAQATAWQSVRTANAQLQSIRALRIRAGVVRHESCDLTGTCSVPPIEFGPSTAQPTGVMVMAGAAPQTPAASEGSVRYNCAPSGGLPPELGGTTDPTNTTTGTATLDLRSTDFDFYPSMSMQALTLDRQSVTIPLTAPLLQQSLKAEDSSSSSQPFTSGTSMKVSLYQYGGETMHPVVLVRHKPEGGNALSQVIASISMDCTKAGLPPPAPTPPLPEVPPLPERPPLAEVPPLDPAPPVPPGPPTPPGPPAPQPPAPEEGPVENPVTLEFRAGVGPLSGMFGMVYMGRPKLPDGTPIHQYPSLGLTDRGSNFADYPGAVGGNTFETHGHEFIKSFYDYEAGQTVDNLVTSVGTTMVTANIRTGTALAENNPSNFFTYNVAQGAGHTVLYALSKLSLDYKGTRTYACTIDSYMPPRGLLSQGIQNTLAGVGTLVLKTDAFPESDPNNYPRSGFEKFRAEPGKYLSVSFTPEFVMVRSDRTFNLNAPYSSDLLWDSEATSMRFSSARAETATQIVLPADEVTGQDGVKYRPVAYFYKYTAAAAPYSGLDPNANTIYGMAMLKCIEQKDD